MGTNGPKVRTLILDGNTPRQQAERVLKALDSDNRRRILGFLSDRIASISEIAAGLDIPGSSTALHIEVLEEAGLVHSEFEPANRGLQKICIRMYDQIVLELPFQAQPHEQVTELHMPIGAFVDCQVQPTCGLLSETGIIGLLDDPTSFYEPDHINAQLLWFRQGYVEYRFPGRLPPTTIPASVQLSMEVCSEAPLYNLNWPSDITVWINQVELGTWTSLADFGGEKGRLTPEWWSIRNTQYGLLKVWQVDELGTKVDGVRVSGVTIGDLNLLGSAVISVRIGVKAGATHVGGLNLFGSHFGNYPQDLVLSIHARPGLKS
jgi:predicted transcriptional regulator